MKRGKVKAAAAVHERLIKPYRADTRKRLVREIAPRNRKERRAMAKLERDPRRAP